MNSGYTCSARSPSTTSDTGTVYIVDDDGSMRETLKSLIRSAGWQAMTASSAEEFMTYPRSMTPGCILVEVSLPGMSGLDLQKHIGDRSETPVIFMSRHTDVRATVQAMKAGAFEFLAKPFTGDVLLHSIRQAMEKSCAELGRVMRMLALQECYESLSGREREVMALVVSGRLNKQIGAELGISEITVKAHRGKVMRKMRASSLPELVNMAAYLPRFAPVSAANPDVTIETANTHRHHRTLDFYWPMGRNLQLSPVAS